MLDFESLPLYWVNRLSAAARRDLRNRFKAAGRDVSPEEWAVLNLLWRKDRQPSGKMADRTVRDATTMTRLVDGMVKKGMVMRRPDAGDRRRLLICLTEKGRGLQPILVELARPLIEQSMAGISAQDAAIAHRVLAKMTENIVGGTE